MKNIGFFTQKIFIFLVVNFSVYLNRQVFLMIILIMICRESQNNPEKPKYPLMLTVTAFIAIG